MNLPVLPTTVVGSLPQPAWLIDQAKLSGTVPRVRADIWRLEGALLAEALDDATLLAIREQEAVGLDIVTDGEIRRESYSNRFGLALEGVDGDKPAFTTTSGGKQTAIPRIVGPIRHVRSSERADLDFLRANTARAVKVTLPGPFTLAQQGKNEFYRDHDEMVMAFAAAVNVEARALAAAGADVIQLDEPWLRHDPAAARRIAVAAINRALDGVAATTVVHLCFGYAALVSADRKPVGYSFLPELAACRADQISIEAAQPKLDLGVLADLAPKTIMLGVIDLNDLTPETPEIVAGRLRKALPFTPVERLVAAPDCGMKYLPRKTATAKLRAMVAGAALVRQEHA